MRSERSSEAYLCWFITWPLAAPQTRNAPGRWVDIVPLSSSAAEMKMPANLCPSYCTIPLTGVRNRNRTIHRRPSHTHIS